MSKLYNTINDPCMEIQPRIKQVLEITLKISAIIIDSSFLKHDHFE